MNELRSRIAVLGMGAMGSRMAINYAKAGHDVVIWNRTRDRAEELADQHGLQFAQTPREAALDADFVVSMVANDEAALDIWSCPKAGALNSISSDAVAIESSTLTPGAVSQLSDSMRARGIDFVEAPVVGSRPQAEAGALLVLTGGEKHAIQNAMPVIEVNAGNVKHVGGAGSAAVLKLAINGLLAAQVAAYAEVVGFIEASDLDSAAAIETLSALPITSPGLERILGLMESRNFDPNFPVHLVAKDVGYLSATAVEMGASMPVMAATRAVYEEGALGVQRDLDISGIASLYLN